MTKPNGDLICDKCGHVVDLVKFTDRGELCEDCRKEAKQ